MASERPSLLRHSRAEERWWSEAGGRRAPRRRGRRPLRRRPRSDSYESSDDPDDRAVWRGRGGEGRGHLVSGPEEEREEGEVRSRRRVADRGAEGGAGARLSATEERLVRMKAGAVVQAAGTAGDAGEDGSLRMDSGIASEEFVLKQRTEEEAASVSDGQLGQLANIGETEVSRSQEITTTVEVHRTESYDQNGEKVIVEDVTESTKTKAAKNDATGSARSERIPNDMEHDSEDSDQDDDAGQELVTEKDKQSAPGVKSPNKKIKREDCYESDIVQKKETEGIYPDCVSIGGSVK